MLNKLKKRNSDGFTIIEVMIVLAIAALILLIVLLAVPALQRNSRNTQRKNDAAQVAAAVGNFISNNGGALPSNLAVNGSNVLVLCASGGSSPATGSCAASSNTETAKLGYYDPTKVYYSNTATITAVDVGSESASAVSPESLIINKKYGCNSAGTGVGDASPRSAGILYVTESGSGNRSLQCVEQ